jgi:hypothetical protein
VIDVDADEEDSDIKPDNKERLTTRVGWLEVCSSSVAASVGLTSQRQLQNAQKLLKRRKVAVPADIVDLTGDD